MVLLGLLALLAWKMNRAPEVVQSDGFIVVDGDSLTRDGARFRLLGIDAPEYRQQCQRDGMAWACGRVAREALVQMLPGGRAECRGRQRDRYDRLLVTCRAGSLDVNAEMVRRGMAVSFGDYQAEEAAARAAKAGLWSGSFERPQDFRHDGGRGVARDYPIAAVGNYLRRLLGGR
jgi:endonuclease YncB( thermonuclease family)